LIEAALKKITRVETASWGYF